MAVTTYGRPAAAEGAALGTGGTIVTVATGEVLVQLALTPVTAVIPGLSVALGVDAVDGAWVLTVFILALAGSLLVAGRLGDLLGHRRVFAAGALVYAVSAAGATVAPGFQMLLVARVGQGIGGALISGNNLAILTRAVDESRRGRAVALVATASAVAALVGSALGTAAVALGGWPLLFAPTVPLALWAAARARRLPGIERDRRNPVDWAGAGLLVLATTVLAVALNHPHTTTSEIVMPVFHTWLPLLAALAAGLFVAVEQRVRVPLLDWRQLRDRAFAAAIGVNALLHLTMMAAMYLGPFLVVRGLEMDTAAGGVLMVLVQAGMLTTAFVGGWLYDRTRSRWIRPAAALGIALSLVGWAFAGLAASYPGLVVAGVAAGLANGVLLTVNNTVVMSSLPGETKGVASGMLETTRHFGHAFGVTIPTAILAIAAAGALPGMEAAALREGSFWVSLAMAVLAFAAAGLALVPSRRGA
jgi:MFS family permease